MTHTISPDEAKKLAINYMGRYLSRTAEETLAVYPYGSEKDTLAIVGDTDAEVIVDDDGDVLSLSRLSKYKVLEVEPVYDEEGNCQVSVKLHATLKYADEGGYYITTGKEIYVYRCDICFHPDTGFFIDEDKFIKKETIEEQKNLL